MHTVRIDDVSASIWTRDLILQGDPRKFFSVSVERSYVDKTGTRRWTSFFDADSLGKLVTVVQGAAEKIQAMQEEIRDLD